MLRNAVNTDETPTTLDDVRHVATDYGLGMLQGRGYWRPRIETKLVLRPKKQRIRWVDVIFDIEEGSQYRLSAIKWTGMHVFTAADLQGVMPIHQGEIASRRAIANGLDALRRLYGNRGYVNFTSVPYTEFDDNARTLGLRIDIDEGGEFFFGDLMLPGLDDVNKEKLLRLWDSIRGTTYSWEKQDAFFRSVMRPAKPEPRNQLDYLQYVDRHVDEAARTVSFSISFLPLPERKTLR